jgi:hypothetical protein
MQSHFGEAETGRNDPATAVISFLPHAGTLRKPHHRWNPSVDRNEGQDACFSKR